MLLGHNWVTNGPFLERHVYYKSDIGISDYRAQESGRNDKKVSSSADFGKIRSKKGEK